MKKKVEYQHAIITYLDMLGFRDLIQKKTAGQISQILRLVQEATKPGKGVVKPEGIQYLSFSDTTIRVIPVSRDFEDIQNHLFGEILNLVHIQATLINHGILLRGAISIGQIRRSWRVTYGPGLVQAYELEQRAQDPRVLIDPAFFEHEVDEELLDMILHDKKGNAFIDYVRTLETEVGIHAYSVFLRKHANFIADGLVRHRHNSKVLSKFEWLRTYHNYVVKKRYRKKVDNEMLV